MRNRKNILRIIILLTVFNIYCYAGEIKGRVLTDANKSKYKANTVVYIEKVEGNFKLPLKNPEINQKNLTFIPHVLPILIGTTVNFLNNDDVLHNVFSPDGCTDKFNLGSWKKGEIKSHKYTKEGCMSVLLCNIHPEMEAYVIVLQNPFFAVTDEDGNFSIKNIPAGKYTLKVWNEKLKSVNQEISVSSNGKVEVNIKLTK